MRSGFLKHKHPEIQPGLKGRYSSKASKEEICWARRLNFPPQIPRMQSQTEHPSWSATSSSSVFSFRQWKTIASGQTQLQNSFRDASPPRQRWIHPTTTAWFSMKFGRALYRPVPDKLKSHCLFTGVSNLQFFVSSSFILNEWTEKYDSVVEFWQLE